MAWITNDAGLQDGNDHEGFHREWWLKQAGFTSGPAFAAYDSHASKGDLWERASSRLDALPYKFDLVDPRPKDVTGQILTPRFIDQTAKTTGEVATKMPYQFGILVSQVVIHFANTPDVYGGFVSQFDVARSIHAGLADLPISAQSALRELLQSSYFGERDEPDEKVTTSAALSYI